MNSDPDRAGHLRPKARHLALPPVAIAPGAVPLCLTALLLALALVAAAPASPVAGSNGPRQTRPPEAAPHRTALEGTAPRWTAARPGYPWSFPTDHWAHPGYRNEWWYFTGHLRVEGEEDPAFGYQFTFFRVGLSPRAVGWNSSWDTRGLIMGHASITDLRRGRHFFSEVLYRETPLLGGFSEPGDSLLAWSLGPPGTDGRWQLLFDDGVFTFRMEDDAQRTAFVLQARPARPLIFQGPGGYSKKGAGGEAASLYYSFTRLTTRGTLTTGGEARRVEGESWMDREFSSNQLEPNQAGWDWFSLQLSDGRDLMLYLLRDRRGRVDFARGTLVASGGKVRYLTAADWTLAVEDSWKSARTGAVYPARWRLQLSDADIDVLLEPLLPDQENVSGRSGVHYWEGAVKITDRTGAAAGRGYVELTGYGEGSRPPI